MTFLEKLNFTLHFFIILQIPISDPIPLCFSYSWSVVIEDSKAFYYPPCLPSQAQYKYLVFRLGLQAYISRLQQTSEQQKYCEWQRSPPLNTNDCDASAQTLSVLQPGLERVKKELRKLENLHYDLQITIQKNWGVVDNTIQEFSLPPKIIF